MAQFVGRNLAITIGGTAVPCPQGLTINEAPQFVEFYCVGTDGKQRIYDGSDWSGTITFFPDATDYSEMSTWSEVSTALALVAYPDGNTAGNIKITCDIYPAVQFSQSRGQIGSVTVPFTVDGSVTFAAATT